MAEKLFDHSEIGKKLKSLLPGEPDLEEMGKEVVRRLSGEENDNLYKSIKILQSIKEQPVDGAISGLQFALEAEASFGISLFNEFIIKRIMLDPINMDFNIRTFSRIDQNWDRTKAINFQLENLQSMIKPPDILGMITVSQTQFYEIMNNKFFEPQKYEFHLVGEFDKTGLSKFQYFNGEEPMYYIYFNNMAKSGILHISQIGVMPIFPKTKQK